MAAGWSPAAVSHLPPFLPRWELETALLGEKGAARREMLQAAYWEPFATDGISMHFRRPTGQTRGAVVISPYAPHPPVVRQVFAGWDLVKPFSELDNRQWPRVVMLWRPTTSVAHAWVRQLKSRLIPGNTARLDYLIP